MKSKINFLQIQITLIGIILITLIYFFNYQEGARGDRCGRSISADQCTSQPNCMWTEPLPGHYYCIDK